MSSVPMGIPGSRVIRYAISNGTAAASDAERWLAHGVDYVQLREKSRNAGEVVALAKELVAMLEGSHTRLLVNGRTDIAIAAGAAGVHLTSSPGELTPAQVRTVFERAGALPPVISVSCHMLEEVRRAHETGVDMILFGPVFEKRVARQFIRDGSGLEMLEAACKAAEGTPVLALGGITEENAGACLAAGAAGIAAIRLFS